MEFIPCDNFYLLQCVLPTAALAPWTQRNSWIFIIVAIAAAAIIVATAW